MARKGELLAPFPWIGGKRRVGPLVWERFGAGVPNYVEPFAGSLAVLLTRPNGAQGIETVNDADGLLCNVWRSIQADPEGVAAHADWIAHECDLHARHARLVEERAELTRRLEGDPEFCDPKLAGWWLWGIALWIGGGWCSGAGPWVRQEADDGTFRLVKRETLAEGETGVFRQVPHLGPPEQGVKRAPLTATEGNGVKRRRPQLGGGSGTGSGINRQSIEEDYADGVKRELPHLGRGQGVGRKTITDEDQADAGTSRKRPSLQNERGVKRQRIHLHGANGGQGNGVLKEAYNLAPAGLLEYMQALAVRIRRVRVCCGGWSRICGPTPTWKRGMTAVFLDPPYSSDAGRDMRSYAVESGDVAHRVREWCLDNGGNPLLRIALCGYADEGHEPLTAAGWECVPWKGHGGYGAGKKGRGDENKSRERIWFSPSCLRPTQGKLELEF